jgi:hypothetical protein
VLEAFLPIALIPIETGNRESHVRSSKLCTYNSQHHCGSEPNAYMSFDIPDGPWASGVQISKWGNSLGLRVRRDVAAQTGQAPQAVMDEIDARLAPLLSL